MIKTARKIFCFDVTKIIFYIQWRRDHPNLHILFYEKMKKNPKEEFTKLSTFLGLDISDTQMDKVRHVIYESINIAFTDQFIKKSKHL